MAITVTFTGTVPTVGASADTWGGTLNSGLGQVKVDLDAIAAQYNVTQPLAVAALPKSGGIMTGDIQLAGTGPSSTLSVGYLGVPTVSIDVDRTFVATDSGKMIRWFGAVGRTATLPPNASAAFPIGTVFVLRNYMTASLTVARGAGVALTKAGALVDANSTVASGGFASVVKEDTDIWVISGTGVA